MGLNVKFLGQILSLWPVWNMLLKKFGLQTLRMPTYNLIFWMLFGSGTKKKGTNTQVFLAQLGEEKGKVEHNSTGNVDLPVQL